MARHEVITRVDDLDGRTGAEPVTFGIDGKDYEIDLHDDNAAALRGLLQRYVNHARRIGGRRIRGTGPKAAYQLDSLARHYQDAHPEVQPVPEQPTETDGQDGKGVATVAFLDAARHEGEATVAGHDIDAMSPQQRRAYSRKVREWARSNNIAVQDRGRVPQWVLDAYREHHDIGTSPTTNKAQSRASSQSKRRRVVAAAK